MCVLLVNIQNPIKNINIYKTRIYKLIIISKKYFFIKGELK